MNRLTSPFVLVLGLDGVRAPDLHNAMIKLKTAPNLLNLLNIGAGTVCEDARSPQCARVHKSGARWVTGPGWCSVITGVSSDKHQVRGNDLEEILPFIHTSNRFPSIFSIARNWGLKTAASGDYGFLGSPGATGGCRFGVVDLECGIFDIARDISASCHGTFSCNLDFRQAVEPDGMEDYKTERFILERIKNQDAGLMFAQFVRVDIVGHEKGWGSDKQLEEIARVDARIGRIIAAVATLPRPCLIVVTADHGGFAFNHGENQNDDESVPFIVAAVDPGGHPRAMRALEYPVMHSDAAPTIIKWLGIRRPLEFDGKVQGI